MLSADIQGTQVRPETKSKICRSRLTQKCTSGTIDNASEVSERIKKSKNILKLFNTIACFIKDEHKNIEKEDQSAQEFMAGYATTI